MIDPEKWFRILQKIQSLDSDFGTANQNCLRQTNQRSKVPAKKIWSEKGRGKVVLLNEPVYKQDEVIFKKCDEHLAKSRLGSSSGHRVETRT